jgi:glutamate carboxypeptidase
VLTGGDLVDRLRSQQSRMTAHLEELVTAESPSEAPDLLAECARRLSTMGAALLGSEPEWIAAGDLTHLVWRLGAPGSPPSVVLVGHYDTVWPAGTLARRPFAVDGEGRATGPGVFDMKAGIVQMFHALAAIDRPTGKGVTVVLTADEETGSRTSRSLIESTTRGARAALVLEPSANGALKVARKGTSMYEIHVTGRSAHAGLEPEKGVNATIELAHQTLAVAALGRPAEGTTVTPTVAASGTATNSVPAAAVLHVDSRATTAAEQQRVDAEVRGLVPLLEGSRLRIEGGVNRPPLDAVWSEGLMALAVTVAAELGLPAPRGVAVGGASDGNYTAGIGVPTLDGLGAEGDGAHAEHEHVLVAAMPDRAALLGGLISAILGE